MYLPLEPEVNAKQVIKSVPNSDFTKVMHHVVEESTDKLDAEVVKTAFKVINNLLLKKKQEQWAKKAKVV